MKRDVGRFSGEVFDLVVIGGGITGACLAHDAALRGLRVALVEKDDFGAATSAASSKLLHGGIRYLPMAQFSKVRESARERMIFQRIAPHMTRHVPFLIPTIDWGLMKGRYALQAGMRLYELVCSGLNGLVDDARKKVPRGPFIGREEVLRQVPLLKGIRGMNGAQVLYEVHMANSERMTLAFIRSAEANGSCVANYVHADRFLQRGNRIEGIACRDVLDGQRFEIRGKIVANATGPFIPGLNGTIDGIRLKKRITGFSKGIHMVTRQIEGRYALAVSSGKKTEGLVSRDGRHIFIIPWRGCSLIGTTNVPFREDLENVGVHKQDIVEFLEDINRILPGLGLRGSDVRYAFAGLYPLVSDEIKEDTYQGTGEYQVVDHARMDGIEGLVSVLGAKYTTARAVSAQAGDLIVRKMGLRDRPCRTGTEPLFGGDTGGIEAFVSEKTGRYAGILPKEAVEALIEGHGSRIDAVVERFRAGNNSIERVSPGCGTLVGEVEYAVGEEMACTLSDVVFRRTGMGTVGHPGEEAVRRAAAVMGGMLGWTKERTEAEVESVDARYRCLADL